MWCIVGLGNPGSRYAATRHNAGFWVVDEFVRRHGRETAWSEKYGCDWQSLSYAGEKCLVIKPGRYMNLSGEASSQLLRYYRISAEELIVVHDELDLEPGRVQIKVGGGAGGHRGVADMVQHCGSAGFSRVRVGIGRPDQSQKDDENREVKDFDAQASDGQRLDVTAWVLGRPGPKDKELLDDAVSNSVRAMETILSKGLAAAQRDINKRNRKASACKKADKASGDKDKAIQSASGEDKLKSADGES